MSTKGRFGAAINKCRFLSGNMIKILAAVLMVIDHIGVVLGMQDGVLRILGRISMPLFAFMIAEGARYTKNRAKHLGLMAGLAAICQLVYYFALQDTYMCILVTFSLSTILIYALDFVKWSYLSDKKNAFCKIISPILFSALVIFVYYLTTVADIDYGFYGIMMPVFASLTDVRRHNVPDKIRWIDARWVRVLMMTIPMLMRMTSYPALMWYSFIAIPILLLYSGERGKRKMKYFFYIFYPLHLVIIYAVFLLIYILSI